MAALSVTLETGGEAWSTTQPDGFYTVVVSKPAVNSSVVFAAGGVIELVTSEGATQEAATAVKRYYTFETGKTITDPETIGYFNTESAYLDTASVEAYAYNATFNT